MHHSYFIPSMFRIYPQHKEYGLGTKLVNSNQQQALQSQRLRQSFDYPNHWDKLYRHRTQLYSESWGSSSPKYRGGNLLY